MMSETMKAKRAQLKDMSAAFRILVKEGVYGTVNEGLAHMYAQDGHTELKSYRQWKENGYQVKKGSSALLFWGEPIERNKPEEQPQETGEEDTSKFYPLAYLFSQKHVEPVK